MNVERNIAMFTINGNQKEFTQWEQGYTLSNPNMKAGDKVRFVSSSGESAVMKAKNVNGAVQVEVPNTLLKHASNITVQFVGGGDLTSFTVKSAPKPNGWQLIDNEPRGVNLLVQSE